LNGQRKKSIGILGGMGPMATVDMFQKITELTDAHCDQEHVRVYIDSHSPMPDRGTFLCGSGEDPVPYMVDSIQKLESCGADCIVMPCNTAHCFMSRLRDRFTTAAFLDMIEVTAEACARRYPGKKAGILGTVKTIESGLYRDSLARLGEGSVDPDAGGKALLMEMIFGIKAGIAYSDPAPFNDMLRDMRDRGAEYFILGCTELPIIIGQLGITGTFVDAAVEVAKAAIAFCGYPVKG